MNLVNLNKALEKFGKTVVSRSRANLTRSGKNVSKELYNSLGYDTKVRKNSLSLNIIMGTYGIFQDRGVKGTESGRSLDGFKYKKSSNLIGVEYHTGALAKWAKARGLKFRDVKGRFVSHKQTGFMLANIIKKKGIKPSLFFTNPYNNGLKRLPEEILTAFDLDVEAALKLSLKDNYDTNKS